VEDELPAAEHRRIILFSHAVPIITLITHLAGSAQLAAPIRVGYCSLTTFQRRKKDPEQEQERKGEWVLETLMDYSFLSGGNQRDWGSADMSAELVKVVTDPGVPGTGGEDEGPSGLQSVGRM
jgi:transcription factor C subunit 7